MENGASALVEEAPAGHPPAGRATRRSRDQTRALLLSAAEDLLLGRLARDGELGNPVAALRITDVLVSINSRSGPEIAPLTTGAAYQIWNSQRAFQDDFLDHLMAKVAMPWLGRLRRSVDAAMAAGASLPEVLATMSADDLLDDRQAADLSLALGLTALVSPDRIKAAEEEANAGYVREFGRLLADIVEYAGRRLVPGRTIEDLVWAMEAVAAGAHLRTRSHPDVFSRQDSAGSSLSTTLHVAIVSALTEPGRARCD